MLKVSATVACVVADPADITLHRSESASSRNGSKLTLRDTLTADLRGGGGGGGTVR
jgi:hypothetical protein